jgi:hypothetical protein
MRTETGFLCENNNNSSDDDDEKIVYFQVSLALITCVCVCDDDGQLVGRLRSPKITARAVITCNFSPSPQLIMARLHVCAARVAVVCVKCMPVT